MAFVNTNWTSMLLICVICEICGSSSSFQNLTHLSRDKRPYQIIFRYTGNTHVPDVARFQAAFL